MTIEEAIEEAAKAIDPVAFWKPELYAGAMDILEPDVALADQEQRQAEAIKRARAATPAIVRACAETAGALYKDTGAPEIKCEAGANEIAEALRALADQIEGK